MPSAISLSQSPLAAVTDEEGGCILNSATSIKQTVSAWMSKQGPGPIKVRSTPPIDGPMTLVKLWVAEWSAKALTTPSCGTRVTTTTCWAAVLKELTMAMKITSTAMCQNSSKPEKTRKAKIRL